MLGVFKDTGKVVALIPSGISGYSYFDFETGRRRKINRKNESLFETEAIAFYKPLPLKKIGMGDVRKVHSRNAVGIGLRDDRAGHACGDRRRHVHAV